jgi:hypothetical protein
VNNLALDVVSQSGTVTYLTVDLYVFLQGCRCHDIMMKSTQRNALKVGDRVRLVRGSMRGHAATIAAINDGAYFLTGDWTKQTGFVLVKYGPVEPESLEKLSTANNPQR